MNWSISGNVRRLRRKSVIGQLVLVVLGVQLLMFASFTCLELPSGNYTNMARFINVSIQDGLEYLPANAQESVKNQFPVLREQMGPIRFSPYVPLAPVAIFIGYVLGVPLGFIATAIFLALGLIGPYIGLQPLAAGGGIDYYRQPTFGYLIGMVVASWFSARVTLVNNNSLRQLVVVVGGLTILHLVGLIYLAGSSLGVLLFEGEVEYLKWQPWLSESIRNLSWYALPYDCLFSVAQVGLGFPFRWLTGVLTAPDIAMRSKPRWDGKLEEQVTTEYAQLSAE